MELDVNQLSRIIPLEISFASPLRQSSKLFVILIYHLKKKLNLLRDLLSVVFVPPIVKRKKKAEAIEF